MYQVFQPSPVNSAVTTPQSKSNIWVLIIGAIMLLGGGITIGLLLGKQLYSPTSQLTPSPSPISQFTPTPVFVIPTADPTANWKTYINTEYNYLLKYPSNLTVGENGMARGDTQKAFAIVLYEDKESTFESPRFAVTVRLDSNALENTARQHYQKLTTNRLSEKEKETASKNLGYTISDNQAINQIIDTTFLNAFASFQYTIKGSTVDDGASEYGVPEENRRYIWVEANNKVVLISFTDTNTMTQILSTFKFLDQDNVSNLCTTDADCGVNICDCKADLNQNIPVAKKACARYCPGAPRCINNRCQLVTENN